MPSVSAAVPVPGPEEPVLELWYDTRRWPAFVDGLKAVVRVDQGWPAGGYVEWESTPHGPGRTRETAVGDGAVRVEDASMSATRTVRYDGDRLQVTLEYELKGANPFVGLFVRRALRDSLQRTLGRFAAERRGDLEL
jgi:Arc/MetJ family transcription regulator